MRAARPRAPCANCPRCSRAAPGAGDLRLELGDDGLELWVQQHALPVAARALPLVFGELTREQAPELHELLARLEQGLHSEAASQAERVALENLEIQRRVLGPEHTAVLWTMNNLAYCYQSEGRLDEAERLHLETLAIRRRVFGTKHPDTCASLYNLACVSALRGDRVKGLDWLRQDVEAGEIDAELMATDPELRSLHGPEFDALLIQVRRNAAAARGVGVD